MSMHILCSNSLSYKNFSRLDEISFIKSERIPLGKLASKLSIRNLGVMILEKLFKKFSFAWK